MILIRIRTTLSRFFQRILGDAGILRAVADKADSGRRQARTCASRVFFTITRLARAKGVQLRGVLGQAAVAQLFMPEQVLDDVEGVLDPGADLRQRSLDRLRQVPQGFRQRLDDAALDRDIPGHLAVLMFRPPVRSAIAGIGEYRRLAAVQHRRHLIDIGFVGGGSGERVPHPRGNVHPDMRS